MSAGVQGRCPWLISVRPGGAFSGSRLLCTSKTRDPSSQDARAPGLTHVQGLRRSLISLRPCGALAKSTLRYKQAEPHG